MARPNPNTFEKDSPMSPQSAGSNISYQTNVNRQKTKKWAEAKPANYGGDDWGDDYDYDYDSPPPPVPKPTGLRQQGQAMQGSIKPNLPVVDNSKKYGELPPLPGASNPRERANSFDAEDEKRNFSNSTARQPSPSTAEQSSGGPATRFSQITGVPTVRNTSGPPLHISTQQATQPPSTALAKGSQVVSPISGSPHPDILQPGRANTGEGSPAGASPVISPKSDTRTPSSDYQARRDFSPSAVPPPLTTRASPAPQSATDSPTTRFPARKSSLSQTVAPELSEIAGPSQRQAAPKPWTAPRSASPGAAGRSPATPTGTGKALPFIRPADIYRRMEEERERERQSLDSGRPSMDSLVGAKSSDRSDSPAKSHLREKSSSDSLGGNRSRISLDADDASESGRLRPILEPVKERKSEYGLEGFTVNDQASYQESESKQPIQEIALSQDDYLDVEEARRHSTSPKLPDLNRISGFSMDIFSQSKPEDTFLSTTREAETTPKGPSKAQFPLPHADDLTLRNQPSFGFKSVVQQAFDRTDDPSVPNTPVSQAYSGVRRTDSESTGTDGISPIMSRVPSAAVRDRNRDPSNPSNPSILEVVNEPVSPEELSQQRQKELYPESVPEGSSSDFIPGYRRDISTPSRENSPARHADIAKAKIIPSGQHAVVSEASPDSDDEPFQTPRPIADREHSFRPVLPGGWTSYATSADSEAPQQSVERTQSPVSEVSPVKESLEEHDYDITPTNTRHPLPHSSFDATIAGGAFDRHDQPSPSGTPVSNNFRIPPSNSVVSTQDPAMAPIGNLYSTANLDPKFLPKLEQVPPETQLRPDAVNRDVSAESSEAPPPPPKDTSVQESAESDSEYTPRPTVPLKQRTLDQVDNESLEPPRRPKILPTLSTDTGPYDEENDKLRKEIVKSLSPRPSDAGQHHESILEDKLDDGPSVTLGRESTYLPREYDNYWASTTEEEEPVPADAGAALIHEDSPRQAKTVASVVPEAPIEPEIDSTVIPPLSPRRPAALQDAQRPSPQNRFSWEENLENVTVGPHEETTVAAGDIDNDASNFIDEPTDADVEAKNISEPVTSTMEPGPSQVSALDLGQKLEGANTTDDRDISADHHFGRNAALAAGGAAIAGAIVATQGPQSPGNHQRRLSLAEEKDPRVSSYPISPTPPEDEHPAHSPTQYFSPSAAQPSHAPPSTVSPVASPVKPPFSPTGGKLLEFRDILAIQSTQQRIQKFDETRHRWASMDHGLKDWIAKLQSQYPEHANTSGSWAGSRMSAPGGYSRSKFGKAPGGGAPPLQEPYYRQYLNASPATTSTQTRAGPAPGPSLQPASQQSFSHAGNKPGSHQVPSKGKELLHSAGIFGGKAGKAGKGLLAKGKNKLRGAGGGDKTSPPPKPKAERRSSWGNPLSLSRSAGRSESSTRFTKDSTPVQTSERSQVRPDMTAEQSTPAPQLPSLASDHSLGIMRGALPVSGLPQRDELVPSQQFPGSDTAVEESRDTLGVPIPIGKYQPTWDPSNATPIAEEEGFQFEESEMPQFSSKSRRRHESLTIPVAALARSDRSNSSDAHFYDAHEDAADIPNDWILVAQDPEYRDTGVEGEEAESVVKGSTKPEFNDAGVKDEMRAEPEVTVNPGLEYEAAVVDDQTKAASDVKANLEPEYQGSVIEDHTKAEPEVKAMSGLQYKVAPIENKAGPERQLKPEAEHDPMASFDLPTTSILNTPRVSSYGVGSSPPSTAFASTSPPQSSTPVAAVSQPTPPATIQYISSNVALPIVTPGPVNTPAQLQTQPAPQVQPEEQTGSSFLPPIHHTSTFGFGQAKPRFPLEADDDTARSVAQQKADENRQAEAAGSDAVAAEIATVGHQGQNKEIGPPVPQASDARQSLPPQPASTTIQSAQYRGQSSQTQQPPAPETFPRVPPIDTSFRQQPSNPLPADTRPPLVQAGSSEYSTQPGSTRPPLNQAGLSDYSQQTIPSEPNLQQQPKFFPPRAADVGFRPQNFTESHVEWRPNRPKVAPTTAQAPISPSYWKEQDIPPPRNSLDQQSQQSRNSWEPQRGRGYSGSSQSYTQRPDGYGEKAPWAGSPQQLKPFEQPPSAAQRYPDLFRPANPAAELPRESADLPAHYYQGPLPRSAAFLPRQQTNEYQLPGVGPPTDEPRSARRNSGFLKDIGGRLSRGSSRERRNSVSREGAGTSPTRPFDSNGNEYAESEAPSEGALEQKRRRSGFFGMKRGSTSGLGPPVSQESVIAHHPGSHLGSRIDLLATPQPSPTAQHERKRSVFGSHSVEPKTKANKLIRASTGTLDDSGKKKRFSSLGGLFGKSSSSTREPVQQRPQATRELPYGERQPLESPRLSPHINLRIPAEPQTPPQNTPVPSQQRRVLSKTASPSESPRQQSKTRRPSGAGIFGGLMGRRSQQQEKGGSDDSRSQGSQSQLAPQPLPAAQTYTDLQEQEQRGPPPVEPQQRPQQNQPQDIFITSNGLGQPMSTPDRGRRVSREPQYDSVPIPGGYSLVRGQGAIPIPTAYDPRGYNQQQIDPRHAQPRAQDFYNLGQGYGQQQDGRPPKPNLSPIETYNNYNPHVDPRSLSREDVLARSPAKLQEGQQRPYQLSLPGEDSDGDHPAIEGVPTFSSPSTRNRPIKNDAIQRLQQPTLRHPESPAGYPLPDDTVFSPINPVAQNLPPPPAPRWPGPHPQYQPQHANQGVHQHSNSLTHSLSAMDAELNRSNTRRTAASAVSGISDPQNPIQSVRGSLNVPSKNGHSQEEGGTINVMRNSPTPPSPMSGTPEREVSPERTPRTGGGGIKTTNLHIRIPSSSDDLYSASPRLPKPMQLHSSTSITESNLDPSANGQAKRIVSESFAENDETNVNINRRGGSERMRGLKRAQEEKILIGENGEEIEVEIDENEPPKMSATSFPGQEWNPYAHGGWDDGYD